MPHNQGSPRHILIAEDESLLANLWTVAFEQAGFTVDVVYNGQDAIDYLKENPLPVALVVDQLMPFAQGEEVLEALREIDPDHDVYTIFTSAVPSAIDVVVKGKADIFMEKPVQFSYIVSLARDLRDQITDITAS